MLKEGYLASSLHISDLLTNRVFRGIFMAGVRSNHLNRWLLVFTPTLTRPGLNKVMNKPLNPHVLIMWL
jgi:hypothetical protein